MWFALRDTRPPWCKTNQTLWHVHCTRTHAHTHIYDNKYVLTVLDNNRCVLYEIRARARRMRCPAVNCAADDVFITRMNDARNRKLYHDPDTTWLRWTSIFQTDPPIRPFDCFRRSPHSRPSVDP
jgi:hypothetical protein